MEGRDLATPLRHTTPSWQFVSHFDSDAPVAVPAVKILESSLSNNAF